MTYSMRPLQSLVDVVRMENKCHQKEGVTLRPLHVGITLHDEGYRLVFYLFNPNFEVDNRMQCFP